MDTEGSGATAQPPLDCPACGLPAEIVDRFILNGSPHRVEHVKLVCGADHWFTEPVDSLPVDLDEQLTLGFPVGSTERVQLTGCSKRLRVDRLQ